MDHIALHPAHTARFNAHRSDEVPHAKAAGAAGLRLALDQFNASVDAVMRKLDRVEEMVDALPCTTAG